jgi:hypothetical protein
MWYPTAVNTPLLQTAINAESNNGGEATTRDCNQLIRLIRPSDKYWALGFTVVGIAAIIFSFYLRQKSNECYDKTQDNGCYTALHWNYATIGVTFIYPVFYALLILVQKIEVCAKERRISSADENC